MADSVESEMSVLRTKCIELILNESVVIDDGFVYCTSSWDNFSCWPRTRAGTTINILCPRYPNEISNANNATKYCHKNGTWSEKAVYNQCVNEEHLVIGEEFSHWSSVRVIYNVGFGISTLALIVALVIFLYFKSLRCLRNTIHCHLMVSFIVNNIVWIIMRYTLTTVQNSQQYWLCQSITSISNYAKATNFFWMFVEGLYLHIVIVCTYSESKIRHRYLMLIGWGLPLLIIIPWIIVRTQMENNNCWLPMADHTPEDIYDFILNGPIIFVLFVNVIFLTTIIRALITKLRASQSLEARQYRKAVRATVILFPLFGITYILFLLPPSKHPSVKIIFKYINAILQSFQGLLVALFYCFLNGEVKQIVKRKLSLFKETRAINKKHTKTSYERARKKNKQQSNCNKEQWRIYLYRYQHSAMCKS